MHEVERASHDASFLGLALSEGRFLSVKTRNIWRLRLAIREVLRRGFCSGNLPQILIGHITWAGLVWREILGFINASYAFILKTAATPTELWPSVVGELQAISSLLPLLQ